MAVELGRYYVDEETDYPAVVIKDLGDSRVLVRVWSDSSDLTLVALRGVNPDRGVFIPDG